MRLMRLAHWTMASRSLAGTAPGRTSARAHFALNVFLQRDGVVVLRVMRTIEQRYCTVTGGFADRSPGLRCLVDFGRVSAPEFRPLLGIVTEPSAKFGAGSSSRPKPLNQIAYRRFLFINSL